MDKQDLTKDKAADILHNVWHNIPRLKDGTYDLRSLKNWIKHFAPSISADRSNEGAIVAANFDPRTYDNFKNKLGDWIEEGRPIPDDLRKWVAGVLRGEIKRPPARRKGPYKGDTLMRDSKIVDGVQALVDAGFTLSRNNASKHKNSACDMVATYSAESYATVKGIWDDYEKQAN